MRASDWLNRRGFHFAADKPRASHNRSYFLLSMPTIFPWIQEQSGHNAEYAQKSLPAMSVSQGPMFFCLALFTLCGSQTALPLPYVENQTPE